MEKRKSYPPMTPICADEKTNNYNQGDRNLSDKKLR
jgi:hypothetical protein